MNVARRTRQKMNTKHYKNIAKLILVFFWCVVSTHTMPSAIAAEQSLECACNPSACACSHDCHENDQSEKGSLPKLISASCQSGRNAVEANLNFEIYPPTTFSAKLISNNSAHVFLKSILVPPDNALVEAFVPNITLRNSAGITPLSSCTS